MKWAGSSPGWAMLSMPKKWRGIDHGAEHVAVAGHAHDVLSGVGEIDLALPGHDAEDVEAEQHARGMEFGIGLFEEAGDDVGALRAASGLAGRWFGALADFGCWLCRCASAGCLRFCGTVPQAAVRRMVGLLGFELDRLTSCAASDSGLLEYELASFWSPSAGNRT